MALAVGRGAAVAAHGWYDERLGAGFAHHVGDGADDERDVGDAHAQTVAGRLVGDVEHDDALEIGRALTTNPPPHAHDVVVHPAARQVLT